MQLGRATDGSLACILFFNLWMHRRVVDTLASHRAGAICNKVGNHFVCWRKINGVEYFHYEANLDLVAISSTMFWGLMGGGTRVVQCTPRPYGFVALMHTIQTVRHILYYAHTVVVPKLVQILKVLFKPHVLTNALSSTLWGGLPSFWHSF